MSRAMNLISSGPKLGSFRGSSGRPPRYASPIARPLSALVRSLLLVVAVVMMSGCSHTRSTVEFDEGTDFDSLTTYRWTGSPTEAFGSRAKAEHYRNAMETNLESKGFLAVTENPDFLIRTLPLERYQAEYDTVTSGQLEFSRSTLRVEFVNAQTEKLIWRGTADAYFPEDASPEKAKKAISEAVSTLLKDFPPCHKD